MVCALVLSCKTKKQDTEQSNYFNIQSYLDTEIKSLSKTIQTLEKTVSINGQSETKLISPINFSKELEPFREGNINKSAWNSGFTVDSNEYSIIYNRISDKIPVKSVMIYKNDEIIDSIKIIIERNNILYHTIDTLRYFSSKGYEIRKHQKIILIPQKDYIIKSYFK